MTAVAEAPIAAPPGTPEHQPRWTRYALAGLLGLLARTRRPRER